ncbi:MAG: methylmalonyl-CoA mutase family protein [Anaerolineales bacterium]
MSQTLEDARKEWEEKTLTDSLARMAERRFSFSTSSGIDGDRIFLPKYQEEDYLEKLGFPGEFPYTRGIQATMYRGRLWTMRQYAGFASASDTNRRFKFLLEQGQTGLSVAFDLPTQIGYDADDPIAAGEVGKVGVSISCLDDMAQLFDEIPLGQVSTSMTINAPAAILLAMYISVARRKNVELKMLRGTVQNDILKEYIARGTYIFPPQASMRLITDTMLYCNENLPRWNTISISGYHIREAGATAVQELAFTLSNAIAYVQSALEVGLGVDDFAPQLTFFFSSDRNFLEEVAKFRAARRLWARIMRDRFKANNPKSLTLRFHTQTAGSSLAAQQPENNIVRVALQALAACLGGTQSLHTNSKDEALGLPSQDAVQTALRTQQIIAHESGVTNTIDPLAGSYLIEYLTDEIEARAEEYIQKIDDLGGARAAIQRGFIQKEIQDSAYKFQLAVEQGEATIVGVNAFTMDEEISVSPLKVDPQIEEDQKARLTLLRDDRDNERVERLLDDLESAAGGDENLLPHFIDCVEGDVTLGEICNRLRNVWGEYQASSTI